MENLKKIGVWLDKEKAHIICVDAEKSTMKTIQSNVENFNIHGGSGTRFKGGPQDVVQDSRYLEREKNQLKLYFKNVTLELKEAQAIVIFGPSKIKERFRKELQGKYKAVSAKIEAVKTADSMTNNQMKALVRDYFKLNKTERSS